MQPARARAYATAPPPTPAPGAQAAPPPPPVQKSGGGVSPALLVAGAAVIGLGAWYALRPDQAKATADKAKAEAEKVKSEGSRLAHEAGDKTKEYYKEGKAEAKKLTGIAEGEVSCFSSLPFAVRVAF